MGKSKSSKASSSSSSAKSKKCTCDHPFQCDCGNRPERPSRGHKWDPLLQQWGGKGHKQKGASGQIATVAQADKVTSVGNVAVKQWQKLPSKLLADLCSKNGKSEQIGMPIYRSVGNRDGKGAPSNSTSTSTAGKHRFRLIIPSTIKTNNKGEHDVILTPSLSVSNEEQAKEEAALLGLLYLFPKLPHERTLPDPYRSTYLAALKNSTTTAGAPPAASSTANTKATSTTTTTKSSGTKTTTAPTTTASSSSSGTGATANTQLAANLPSFHNIRKNSSSKTPSSSSTTPPPPPPLLLTKAQINEARLAHQREVNARIRKHEAVRNANKPMEVFMSAEFRRRIERLLLAESGNDGDHGEAEEKEYYTDDDDDDNNSGNDNDDEEGNTNDEDVIQSYVQQRLIHEGFTRSHVKRAYKKAVTGGTTTTNSSSSSRNDNDQDQQMDKAYEQTLQYLCIHLKEDQLPIGFDPRGGTLDVVTNSTKSRKNNNNMGSKSTHGDGNVKGNDDASISYDTNTEQFSTHFGLTLVEAHAIISSEHAFKMETQASSDISNNSWEHELVQNCILWKALCHSSSLPMEQTCLPTLLFASGIKFNNNVVDSVASDALSGMSSDDQTRNEEAATNELEALEAIFSPEEYSVRSINNTNPNTEKKYTTKIVSIALPHPTSESKLYLEVHYINGVYPDLFPMAFLTSGSWDSNNSIPKLDYQVGGNINLKISQFFVSDMNPGQECIFELFGYVQSLLQDEETWFTSLKDATSLLSHLNMGNDSNDEPINSRQEQSTSDSKSSTRSNAVTNPTQPSASQRQQQSKQQQPSRRYRPREKSTFWNKSPLDTIPAKQFPNLPSVLDRARKSLPAAKAKDEFLSLMERASSSSRVTLVTGETGCGKTTQIPQFILENFPQTAKIIVAQPRRLAATGVASRVALERGESRPGTGSVGYVVRGDSKMTSATRLVFCTTGVLLRQLQSNNALENITHIVIDEVHERHLDSDILLAILKRTLPSLPKLNVILMSATMDAERFALYWGENTPRMHIPGFTYPVNDFFLEDVLAITNYVPQKKKKNGSRYNGGGGKYQIQPSFVDGDTADSDDDNQDENPAEKGVDNRSDTCTVPLEERLKRMNQHEIDYDLIGVLVKTLLRTKNDDGSILVFLPGAGEIDRTEKAIQQVVKGHNITILPLHGGLQPEHQQRVFVPASKGCTKIILSTNVAETSITIPDCTIVVDTCKEKQSSFDPINRMPLLLEQFASQDSLKQRRGRSGRVREGTCYKLISSSLYSKLPEHGEPEIRRCALDQSILSLLFIGLENGSGDFLNSMLDAPSKESIESSFLSLEKIGAVSRNGGLLALTPLGTHLAGIPAPPTVGKLLIMGCLLGCRNMAIAIAAGMSAGRSPFLRINTPFFNRGKQPDNDVTMEKQELANEKILEERASLFRTVGNSDHAMLGMCFLLWEDCRSVYEKRQICDRLGLSFNSMKDMSQLARQLDSSLNSSGFITSNESNKHEKSWRIVRSVVVAALSPTQVVRVQRPSTKYTETIEGAIEKDGKAKELKFFIQGGSDIASVNNFDDTNSKSTDISSRNEERVFLHPSSNNFAIGSFSCPWLVYHRLVRTSKAFISDATEGNAYALLLFGGNMEVQASKGIINIDNRIQLSANARIGSLIGAMRRKVDDLLDKKVANPSLDIAKSVELKLITDLLRNEGLS